MLGATGEREVGIDAKAAALAILLTVGLFLLLPYVHLVVPAPPPSAHLIEIPIVSLPPTPPALPPPEVVQPVAKAIDVPPPELPTPTVKAVPLTPVLDFDFALGSVGGDFGLGFSVEADASALHSAGLFELAEVDTIPQAVVQMRPFYPGYARRRRIEGEVTVLFTVNTQGETGNIQVIGSQPESVFEDAAIRAVARWRFTPAIKDGAPVAVRVRQVIRFRMED